MLAIAEGAHLSEDDDEPFELEVALAERDDLRAALDWTIANDVDLAARLAVSLETFWNAHAQNEGLQRLDAIVAHADGLAAPLRAEYCASPEIRGSTTTRRRVARSGKRASHSAASSETIVEPR